LDNNVVIMGRDIQDFRVPAGHCLCAAGSNITSATWCHCLAFHSVGRPCNRPGHVGGDNARRTGYSALAEWYVQLAILRIPRRRARSCALEPSRRYQRGIDETPLDSKNVADQT
jgi:hypothetical protein